MEIGKTIVTFLPLYPDHKLYITSIKKDFTFNFKLENVEHKVEDVTPEQVTLDPISFNKSFPMYEDKVIPFIKNYPLYNRSKLSSRK